MSLNPPKNILTGWEGFDDGRRRGYSMLPGVSGHKKALVRWKPYQESKPSNAEVDQWKRQFTRINPIMVTGFISGLVVLDQDGVIGYEECRKRGGLCSTVTVQTPRGDFHEHFWFKRPSDLKRIPGFTSGYHDNDLPSLDLRADRCIAVYPGGTNKVGAMYRFKQGHSPDEVEMADLPVWLDEYLRRRAEEIEAEEAERQERIQEAERLAQLRESSLVLQLRRRQEGMSYAERLKRYAEAALRNQIEKVATASPSTRNAQLNRSAYALAAFLNEGMWSEVEVERDLEQAAIECGLANDPNCGLSGIRSTIRSGLRAGRRNRVILQDRQLQGMRP